MSAIGPRLIATNFEGWNSPGMAWVGVMLSATLSVGVLGILLLVGLGFLLPLAVTLLVFAGGLAAFAKLDALLIAG